MKQSGWKQWTRGGRLGLAAVGAAALVMVAGAGGFLWLQAAPSRTAEAVLVVQEGMSAGEIARELARQNAVRSTGLFQLMAKLAGLEHSLQAGEYAFAPGLSTGEVVRKLAAGETRYLSVTIPEGYTVRQIAALLQEKGLGSSERFLQLAKASGPDATGPVQFRAEGYLFPDTYRIPPGMKEEAILAMMLREFDKRFTPLVSGGTAGLSPREVVILASLVEKEAQRKEEQPVIARVFLNRLQQGMPLQSCATIQYLLGYPKEELALQDTQIESPYNTYLHPGLPPGPIANPGLGALKAVLAPAAVGYLYFVADKTGRHHFSQTYAEHLAAIEQVR